MNTQLFIRRPITTTLIMAAILIFGIFAYRLLPVSDLPNVDFPTIQVNASLARRQPGHHGCRRGAAAGKTVLHHRRPGFHDLIQRAGRHQHHAAVHAGPQH